MNLETLLGPGYQLGASLPALTPTHQRFKLTRSSKSTEKLVVSFRPYETPLNDLKLKDQELYLERLRKSPIALICSHVDHHLAPDYHWIISEDPGETTLAELATPPHTLRLDEIEAFTRLLATACQSAVDASWPRLNLDPKFLALSHKLGLPRVPFPDLLDEVAPAPSSANEYTLAFSLLCSELLGQCMEPLAQPSTPYIPNISPAQNEVLLQARLGQLESLDEFVSRFFQNHSPREKTWMTETVWNVTAKLPNFSSTEASMILSPPTRKTTDLNKETQRTRLAFENPKGTPLISKFGNMEVRPEDRANAQEAVPCTSLRLTPLSDEASSFSLTSLHKVYLGRSSLYSDFLAQFRPRNDINDSRTLKISRQQASVEWRKSAIFFQDAHARNPSTYQCHPISESGAALKLPVQLNLAGEYPLEVLHLGSDFPKTPTIDGIGKLPSTDTKGALLFRACGAGVLLTECCLLFTDITLHFSDTGRAWMKGGSDWDEPFARLHRFHNQYWLEALATQSIYLMDSVPEEVGLHQLIHLRPGRSLRLGDYTYVVEEYRTQPFDSNAT